MRYSLFSALVLGLSAVVQAGIESPPAGAQWPVAQNQQITWDTTGLTPPLDIHLVPAGAVDTTVIIEEIVTGISNTGSFTWAPDSSISQPNVEIIIVDAKQVLVISEVFEIIIVEVTSTKKLTTTTPTKTSTILKLSTVTKLATVSSVVTTKPLTTSTVNALITTTSIKITTLTTPAILSTTSKPLNTTSTKLTTTALGLLATTTSKPLTTSTSTKPLNTSTSSIRVNATVVAATSKATFTGAAAHLASSNTYSLVSGGLLGLIAMVFL